MFTSSKSSVYLLFSIFAGVVLMLLPGLAFSPIPTQWGPGIDFGRQFILENGRIYDSLGHALTWQSSIVQYAGVDVFPKLYFAMLNIITGTTNFPGDLAFLYFLPLGAALFIPIFSSTWYSRISKSIGRFNPLDLAIVAFFSMFPLASMVQSPLVVTINGNTFAISLWILIVSLFLTRAIQESRKLMIIQLVLIFVFYYYYHTWSFFLLPVLFATFLYSARSKERNLLKWTAIIGMGLFAFYALYINSILISEPITSLKNAPNLLASFFSITGVNTGSPYLAYTFLGSPYGYLQFANSILILSLCLIFLIYFLNKKRHGGTKKCEDLLLLFLLVSEPLIALGLSTQGGLSQVYSRIFESLTFLAVIIAAYLVAVSDNRLRKLVRIILLLSVSICIISYLAFPFAQSWALTHAEYEGIAFTGSFNPRESYVFSDFRLGTPLVYFGQEAIVTLDSPSYSSNNLTIILNKLFYNVSDPQDFLASIIPSNQYSVILSTRMSQVGIGDSSLAMFKTPPSSFIQKWDVDQAFDTIYQGGGITVYAHP